MQNRSTKNVALNVALDSDNTVLEYVMVLVQYSTAVYFGWEVSERRGEVSERNFMHGVVEIEHGVPGFSACYCRLWYLIIRSMKHFVLIFRQRPFQQK